MRFLIHCLKYVNFSYISSNSLSPGGLVTLPLQSGFSSTSPFSVIACLIIVSSTCDISTFPLMNEMRDIFKETVHQINMKQLAELYQDYILNKKILFFNNTVINLDIFKNFPSLIYNNNYTCNFVHNVKDVNVWLPTITAIKCCIANIHLVVPCIVFIFKPLLHTLLDYQYNLLKELLCLSIKYWYLFLEKIIEYLNYKEHKLCLIMLNYFTKKFDLLININEEKSYKVQSDMKVSYDFPLFNTPESDAELQDALREVFLEQDECKEILMTIRYIEAIICSYFNNKHILYPKHYLDPNEYDDWNYLDLEEYDISSNYDMNDVERVHLYNYSNSDEDYDLNNDNDNDNNTDEQYNLDNDNNRY